MICPKCGSQIKNEAVFCSKCGTRVLTDKVNTVRRSIIDSPAIIEIVCAVMVIIVLFSLPIVQIKILSQKTYQSYEEVCYDASVSFLGVNHYNSGFEEYYDTICYAIKIFVIINIGVMIAVVFCALYQKALTIGILSMTLMCDCVGYVILRSCWDNMLRGDSYFYIYFYNGIIELQWGSVVCLIIFFIMLITSFVIFQKDKSTDVVE